MTKFILTSPTRNLGGGVLSTILTHSLIPTSDLILATSRTDAHHITSRIKGATIEIRTGVNFKDHPSQILPKLEGGDVLFLSSYPSPSVEIWLYHKNAVDAAVLAGVKTIIYTSLMFGGALGLESVAGVQQAHIKTIKYLDEVKEESKLEGREFEYIVVREGIYAQSWWLHAGYQPKILTKQVLEEKRKDGNGLSLVMERLLGVTSISEVAKIAAAETGVEVDVQFVGKDRARDWHLQRKSAGEGGDWIVESWLGWFDGLRDGECAVVDPLLGKLMKREPKAIEELRRELFLVR